MVVVQICYAQFRERCQVHLMDFVSCATGEYKFLLQCQDHLTKYCFLKPLKSKKAREVEDTWSIRPRHHQSYRTQISQSYFSSLLEWSWQPPTNQACKYFGCTTFHHCILARSLTLSRRNSKNSCLSRTLGRVTSLNGFLAEKLDAQNYWMTNQAINMPIDNRDW